MNAPASGEVDAALLLACGRHPLAAEVARGYQHAGVVAGTRVLVAVSGGADSMALLALTAGLARGGRIEVAACHVDHGLRAESAAEGELVAGACARLGIACDRRRIVLAPGASLADRARQARYSALAEAAAQAGAPFVATAHHADDQLETMLLAIARGSGLRGLGGIVPRRAMDEGALIVRPCLRLTASALRAACVALELRWCEDPTNAHTQSPRGRMRHIVLPALEQISPGAPRRAALAAEVAQLGQVLLEAHLQTLRAFDGSFPRAALRNAPAALAASALHLLAGERLGHADLWRAAEAAGDEATHPRRYPLAGGGVLLIDAHAVRVCEESPAAEAPSAAAHDSPATHQPPITD